VKQIDPSKIESPEDQDRRAREKLRVKPMISCALIIGAIVFVVPAGGPWMSQEAFISAMGRLISHSWLINLVGHIVLSIIYGVVTASFIYRLRLGAALFVSVLVGLFLYAVNYAVFAAFLGYTSNEIHVGIEHAVFCLFYVAAYKAASVPRPRWKATGKPVEAE
jgi:hypothetical protein